MSNEITRRRFVSESALVAGTFAALPASAARRVVGANDRISIGHVGPGARGHALLRDLHEFSGALNAEVTAVCDLWTGNRDRGAATVAKQYGREPRKFKYLEEMLALKDLDGVVVSTGDFQHAKLLVEVVKAGKDCYCEKPMANVLAEAKEALRVVKGSQQVVQIGTQGRSSGMNIAASETVRSGVLGTISKIEIMSNYHGPRWRGRSEVSQLREEDTDWKRWLLGKPSRPFDPRAYFEFRLYRDFSSGIPDQWMSHAIDAVHMIMDDYFPRSVVANGGVFVWKDGRENSDTFQALLTYPKGFLVSYSTSFGNDFPGGSRYYGTNGTLDLMRGDDRKARITGAGGKGAAKIAAEKSVEPSPNGTHHMKNWLECIRSRKEPNASVRAGYAHSVAVIMAAQAERTSKKLYWDPKKEEITDREPT